MPTQAEIIKAMAAQDMRAVRERTPADFKVSTDYQLEQSLQQSGSGYSSDHRKEVEMYTGWNYVAIHAIATQCGQAACYAYTEEEAVGSVMKSMYNDKDDQGRPVPKDSPLLKFLKRPNPQQSGSSFRFEMALQLKLTGKVLIWNMTNTYGKVVRRYIIPTAIVEPKQPNKDYPEGYYKVKPELARQGGQQGWFFAGQHMSKLHWNLDARHVQVILDPHPVYRDDGQSSVSAGALWTDSSNHIDTARTNHMRLGPDPSVHVHIAGQMDAQELKGAEARFNQKYCGTDRAGRAMFTSGDGVSVTPLSNTARDMAYGEGFMQMRDAIMALHKVPPTAAGIEQATGGESLYAPLKQFIFLTIQPILNLFADEDNESWVWQYGEGHYVEYRAKAIDEPEQRNREHEILMKAGAITKGELRLRMGMQLFGDERDDEIAGAASAPEAMPGMEGGTPAAMGMDGTDSVPNPPPQFFGSQEQQAEEGGESPSEPEFFEEEQERQQDGGDSQMAELDQIIDAIMASQPEAETENERLQKSLASLISEFKAKGANDTCGAGSPGGKGFAPGNTCATDEHKGKTPSAASGQQGAASQQSSAQATREKNTQRYRQEAEAAVQQMPDSLKEYREREFEEQKRSEMIAGGMSPSDADRKMNSKVTRFLNWIEQDADTGWSDSPLMQSLRDVKDMTEQAITGKTPPSQRQKELAMGAAIREAKRVAQQKLDAGQYMDILFPPQAGAPGQPAAAQPAPSGQQPESSKQQAPAQRPSGQIDMSKVPDSQKAQIQKLMRTGQTEELNKLLDSLKDDGDPSLAPPISDNEVMYPTGPVDMTQVSDEDKAELQTLLMQGKTDELNAKLDSLKPDAPQPLIGAPAKDSPPDNLQSQIEAAFKRGDYAEVNRLSALAYSNPEERATKKSRSPKKGKSWQSVEKATIAPPSQENLSQSREADENESENVASSANNNLDDSIMGISVKGLSPDEIAQLKKHAKGHSKFHMEQMIVAMQEGAFFEEAHEAAVAAEEESEGYAKAVSDNTIKGISVEGLTQRQIKTLKKHSSHHSKEIFEQIIIDMRSGKTFTEAHEAAKQKESKTKSDWIKYVGPRGGTGWKSQSTGRIVRGKVRPDERRRPGSRGTS